VRAFLGVAVDEPALAAAAALLAQLRRDVADVRWVRDEGLHLTLHFFGALAADRVDAARAAMAQAAAATAPFPVRLAGLGSFPGGRRERVLWIGTSEGAAEMAALAERCRAGLADAGFAVEDPPFRAHSTLGRPRGTALTAPAREAWEQAAAASLPAFTADRLILYESVPAHGGARYLPLAETGFAQAGSASAGFGAGTGA
jgi:2'-5' RNA ligase